MIPYVNIDLDKPRRLRLSFKVMVEFERITKIKVTQLGDDMGMETIAKLLWVMLKQDDPELTIDKTLELMDEHLGSLSELNDIVTGVMKAAYPREAGDQKNAGKPSRAGKN